MKGVSFRNIGPVPDRAGWFYARFKYSGSTGAKIIPTEVSFDTIEGGLIAWHRNYGWFVIDSFEWFGPVAEVREG